MLVKLERRSKPSPHNPHPQFTIRSIGSRPFIRCYHAPIITKRTAISDERIIEATDETVRFSYTDSQTGERREVTLSATEFMRRYLRHVPEPGQHRVRYFGWMHPAAKLRRMRVETLLRKMIVVRAAPPPRPDWSRCCPHCGKFALVCIGLLPRGPPP